IVHNALRGMTRSGRRQERPPAMRSSLAEVDMTFRNLLVAACLTASVALGRDAQQGPAGAPAPAGAAAQGAAGGGQGGRAGGTAPNRTPIGGTLTPAVPDARGWGWQVKASLNPATPRPFSNK